MKYRIKSYVSDPTLKFTKYIPQRRYKGIKWLLGWYSGVYEFSEEHALERIEEWKEEANGIRVKKSKPKVTYKEVK
jgi:hypothetical protein